MKYLIRLLSLMGLIFLASCNNGTSKETATNGSATSVADAIYFGGDIITMESDSATYVEAIALKDGKILFTGSKAEAEKMKGDSTAMNDLHGKTLVPGFVDGHAHFAGFGAQAVGANLLASPDGNANSIDDIVKELKDWYAANGTDKTMGWIFGMGYDDAVIKEQRHPTKADLDKVSTTVPIVVVHISGHFCVMNTKALALSNITAASKDPAGGIIRRMPGSKEPNGVLEEMAGIPVYIKIISPVKTEDIDYFMGKGQDLALKFGYTTAQEGRAMDNHEQLASYAKEGKLKIDIVSYIDYSFSTKYLRSEWYSPVYKDHYRIGGSKLTLDGSPQGRTAWRTIPYLLPPPGEKKTYKGYPAIADDNKVKAIMDSAFANHWQLLCHANGDAAIDQYIRCLRTAVDKYGNDDRRNVLIHGQFIRKDQLDSLKVLQVIPSMFPMHTFYWGDWYKQIIGDSLAMQISPINTAVKMGMMPTSHTDAPVAFPNLMMVMWATVNRVSRSGAVIGADERLTPYNALKAITIWGARQHFEEKNKGSFTVGKLGDMVVLSDNPLKIDPMKIKDIIVLQTIKEGKTIYKK
jgi:predicted amidohydrolase YtcJ